MRHEKKMRISELDTEKKKKRKKRKKTRRKRRGVQ